MSILNMISINLFRLHNATSPEGVLLRSRDQGDDQQARLWAWYLAKQLNHVLVPKDLTSIHLRHDQLRARYALLDVLSDLPQRDEVSLTIHIFNSRR